jgi:hypothetical protein
MKRRMAILTLMALALFGGVVGGGLASTVDAIQLANIRVIAGMATTEVTLTPHADSCAGVGFDSYWHCDESGVNAANVGLDVTNARGATAGAAVYLQTFGYSGYAFGYTRDHIGTCPGVDVSLWIPYPDAAVGTWIGSVNFVQFPRAIANGTEIRFGTNWTIVYLGSLPSGAACALSTGPHLHQSGTPGVNIATNVPVTGDDDGSIGGVQIYATGSYPDNWLHNIAY